MKQFLEGVRIEPRPAIREKVYQYLRCRILSGEIPPGQRLSESKLAKEVGTSRTPIREALHNLEFEKIITARPKIGYVVREFTAEDVREICEIRTALESLAVRWALRRRVKSLVPKLRANVERMARDIEGELRESAKLDTEFHDLICQASGSNWLADLSHNLRSYMHRLRLQGYGHRELAKKALEGHRRILEALEKRDAASAEEAVARHLRTTIEDVIFYIIGQGSSPGAGREAPR